MRIAEAVQIITDECIKTEGMEIYFTDAGPEIYWGNLRVQCDGKELQKALKAIKLLAGMGAYFG